MTERDDAAIRELIDGRYAELEHELGWSALYCPLSVRLRARIATLGLNPGGGRDKSENWHDKRQFSDEVGNSYFVQRWAGEGYSGLQVQFRRLTEVLKIAPNELLSANLVPFRSPSWAELPRKAESLAFGISLLPWLLESSELELVVMFGLGDAEGVVVDALDAEEAGEISTGWGKTTARFYNSQKLRLVGLPHLSRYQIFGREGARELEERLASLVAG